MKGEPGEKGGEEEKEKGPLKSPWDFYLKYLGKNKVEHDYKA